MTPELERVAKNYLLQLAQVCSRWHSVAMGTPKLWSLIVFDTAVWTQHCCCSQTLLDLVTSSLRRGGECPLTLRIAVNHGDRGEAAVLQLLAEHSHRWKRVSLWINPPSLSHLLRAKGNLGRLRSLDLLNRDSASQSGSSNDIFELAPRLNVVRLINWRGPIPVLPWKQLRNAGLGAIGLGGILPLLSKRARIIIPPDLPLIVSQPVSSQITTLVLDLNGEHPETGGHFLQSLTLPRLKVFSVPRQASLPRWIHGPFLDFASRSSLHARLTRLALYVIIEDRELLECLAVLPLLKELYITDSDDDSHPALVTDNLLRSLMVRPDDTCLVPSLFRLQVTSRFTSHDDVVWDLITSRVNHQCLRDGFRLGAYWGGSQDHGFSPEFTARLKELEAADGGFHFTTGQDPSV
ncbi:hypothetical protein C8R46DRAFT_1056517 [Mycena filopes]|nr:hypothetical protein C8R46DRAFT_1056517 [Mycena filopes]